SPRKDALAARAEGCAAHPYSPSPQRGEGWGEGVKARRAAPSSALRAPSPRGGEGNAAPPRSAERSAQRRKSDGRSPSQEGASPSIPTRFKDTRFHRLPGSPVGPFEPRLLAWYAEGPDPRDHEEVRHARGTHRHRPSGRGAGGDRGRRRDLRRHQEDQES